MKKLFSRFRRTPTCSLLLDFTRSGAVTQPHNIPPLIADQRATTDTLIVDNRLRDSAAVMAQPAAVMGNPGLLQKIPDIAALRQQGGGDREQAAAADRTLRDWTP